MTETFAWPVQHSDTGEVTYRVRTAQFGDGYSQVVGDGINNQTQSWPVSYTGTREAVLAIKAFLDRHGGYRSFRWVSPLGELGLYRAASANIQTLGGGKLKITSTFEQAFAT